MHQGDRASEAGQEGCLFHRGVAAADHDDVLVTEEEAVAGGAGADAAAEEAFFTGNAEVTGCRAHGEDDRVRGVRFAVRDDRLDRAAEIDLFDVLGADVGIEAKCLLTHLFHQVGAHDSFAESGEVLDLGGGHEGATELGSLEEQGLELSARGVDTSGVAGRSGTDNDDVMDRGRVFQLGGHASLPIVSADPPLLGEPYRSTPG